MTEKALRWGIVGCGHISSDFMRAMLRNSQRPNQIRAVATSNSKQRAEEFVEKHIEGKSADRPKAYGSYQELFNDPQVDIVYVGVLNHQHKDSVLGALDAGKHVLVEKPMGVNASEVRQMVAKAREKKRFLMEAYWTRFFPAWQTVHQQLSDIGGAQVILCDFGYRVRDAVTKTELAWGGGYLLATGCYPFMVASWMFGGERPIRIKACGAIGEKKTDMWAGITLEYSNNRVANIFYTGLIGTPCQCSVSGPKGKFKFPDQFWCPSKLVEEIEGSESNALHFPVPDVKNASDYHFPNSGGLSYEADHVYDCLKNGQLESEVMSLDESILLAEIFDEVRQQIGVVYPQDKETLQGGK
ncbi:oxidoreductase family, NAD-binding rossmann fold domain-containing protein [Ditylenchus destructor]|nr:oxidoreductase family, NAD-binding rossmann fold domain-containing protein [Ditylenchus destructor]